ncbi:MAG: 3-deoxy-8-phosphooctulonate synthase [Desulfobacterales bacterium]|nr:3-deoxy-8-phosphooctulonate synthase [Desulfobacterales bacterium]
MVNIVKINNIGIGHNSPLALISGPCVIEDYETTFEIASFLNDLTQELNIPFIFKASYDKANRTSLGSFRGPGLEKGLEILERIKTKLDIPILSDVHQVSEIDAAARVLDIIQIPAFLCRQTDFILEIAKTGKVVNIKKGQFLAPWDMANVVEKATSTGNRRILITERGAMFGYNNLVSDFRAVKIMQDTGWPVIFDATHSVQLPGGAGASSGGQREFAPILARAAVASGADGIFLEVHKEPDKALCDGPNSLKLDTLYELFSQLKAIRNIITQTSPCERPDSFEKTQEPVEISPSSETGSEKQDLFKRIKLLLLDVDGVLTDGSIIYNGKGDEIKNFDVRDGTGIRLLMKSGIKVGIVTGRSSKALLHRCKNLGIELIFDGIKDKGAVLDVILEITGVSPEDIAFVGDDLQDLPLMKKVGLCIAVSDAGKTVRQWADVVTSAKGGSGAVREICETILKAQGLWEKIMEDF